MQITKWQSSGEYTMCDLPQDLRPIQITLALQSMSQLVLVEKKKGGPLSPPQISLFHPTCKSPMTAIDEHKYVWERAGIPFPLRPPLQFLELLYLVLGGWKATVWLGPRRFGLYCLTKRIILHMAGWQSTMVVVLTSSFYANKAFLFSPLHSVRAVPPSTPMELGGSLLRKEDDRSTTLW